MDFLEAVRNLKENKCRGIRRPQFATYWTLDECNLREPNLEGVVPAYHLPHILATDWELVPRPTVKKTVKGWVNLYLSGVNACIPSYELYESKEEAIKKRCIGTYLGDPLYIEHVYEAEE